MLSFFGNLPPCLVGMEACWGSHYWAREIGKFGHTVRQMSPQFVKPYVKSNKNDANDAEAICEAVSRPNMRFVTTESIEQQDIQALHRIRDRLVGHRTALANQTRWLLLELGVAMPQGIRHLRTMLPISIEHLDNDQTLLEKDYLSDLYSELVELDEKIAVYDAKLAAICKQSAECLRLLKVPGIGPFSATAIVAAVGQAKEFKNGREFSAWLGLVPRQNSSLDGLRQGWSRKGNDGGTA